MSNYSIMCAFMLSHFRLFATLWTVALQASLSMGFSRHEHWSGLPCTLPGVLSHPGIDPACLSLHLLPWQAASLPLVPPGKPHFIIHHNVILEIKCAINVMYLNQPKPSTQPRKITFRKTVPGAKKIRTAGLEHP